MTEMETNQRKQAKTLAIFSGEWPEKDAKNNETVSKLAVLSRFFPQNLSASKRLETPRNFSVIFLVFVFCVFSFPVTLRNFTNWILRLFEVFAITFGGGSKKGIWFFVVWAFHVLTHCFTPKGPNLQNQIVSEKLTHWQFLLVQVRLTLLR